MFTVQDGANVVVVSGVLEFPCLRGKSVGFGVVGRDFGIGIFFGESQASAHVFQILSVFVKFSFS